MIRVPVALPHLLRLQVVRPRGVWPGEFAVAAGADAYAYAQLDQCQGFVPQPGDVIVRRASKVSPWRICYHLWRRP